MRNRTNYTANRMQWGPAGKLAASGSGAACLQLKGITSDGAYSLPRKPSAAEVAPTTYAYGRRGGGGIAG